jgi:hypothetical protein
VILLADGLEDAFVGVCERFGFAEPVAAYDREKCIEILMRDGCTHEEAEEYFYFNTIGAWVGEQTPVFVRMVTLKTVIEEANDE